jgi:mono/diheme cytochrome c family protein
LRILGEIPLRKFPSSPLAPEGRGVGGEGEPLDPDGNPDTSFLARIPADTAFTFQTLDKRGMVLNMAQTWHQLRPGEVRTNCGGCHAHSQQPTPFEKTAAVKPDYKVWDLVNTTPLLTEKCHDESKKKWDADNESGLRMARSGPVNVEYHRDIRPILQRSCAACHTAKGGKEPAGNLNLYADDEAVQTEQAGKVPGTYYRLAMDERAKFGHKPIGYDSWGYPNSSRYVRMFQSRRSLLTWKVYGERLDGFSNDDFPSETKPGERTLAQRGLPVDSEKNRSRWDLDYTGSPMPPPDAVKEGKVKPLSDEDRRTLTRWIDLGCPIDLDYDPQHPEARGYGWMLDDNRPTLALTLPAAGKNAELSRLLVGMYDYGSGLDMKTFRVTADFAIDGVAAGENLAERFRPKSQGVYELRLDKPVTKLARGRVTVSVADKQGNISRVERTFSVPE